MNLEIYVLIKLFLSFILSELRVLVLNDSIYNFYDRVLKIIFFVILICMKIGFLLFLL